MAGKTDLQPLDLLKFDRYRIQPETPIRTHEQVRRTKGQFQSRSADIYERLDETREGGGSDEAASNRFQSPHKFLGS
jgi:hypothetical protein